MRIFKYIIQKPDDEVMIEMQKGAKILCVKVQSGIVCIWAIVDPDSPIKPREIQIRGTGHLMKGNEGEYIGTVMLSSGALVFHFFISPED